MAKMVVLYRLGRKPPISGTNAIAAAADGKTGRGRKWYRLEATASDCWMFPDTVDKDGVIAFVDREYPREPYAAASIGGEYFSLNTPEPLLGVPNAKNTVDNAVALADMGQKSWAVIIK